jgi:hypothetical protein
LAHDVFGPDVVKLEIDTGVEFGDEGQTYTTIESVSAKDAAGKDLPFWREGKWAKAVLADHQGVKEEEIEDILDEEFRLSKQDEIAFIEDDCEFDLTQPRPEGPDLYVLDPETPAA